MMDTASIRKHLVCRRNEFISVLDKAQVETRGSGKIIYFKKPNTLSVIDRESCLKLRQINDAIDRIDSGDYGFCSECGAPIEIARIAEIPSVKICGACAKLLE